MFRICILFILFLALWGCSSSKSKFVYDDLSVDSGEGVDTNKETLQIKRTDVDDSKPATFDQYRQWRKTNDSSGQTYAEYKQWEAEYKQWIENQAKATVR